MIMLDRWIDAGRRAWLPCPSCSFAGPLWLLGSDLWWVWVQCPTCLTRVWINTHASHGGPRPAELPDVWPG